MECRGEQTCGRVDLPPPARPGGLAGSRRVASLSFTYPTFLQLVEEPYGLFGTSDRAATRAWLNATLGRDAAAAHLKPTAGVMARRESAREAFMAALRMAMAPFTVPKTL